MTPDLGQMLAVLGMVKLVLLYSNIRVFVVVVCTKKNSLDFYSIVQLVVDLLSVET